MATIYIVSVDPVFEDLTLGDQAEVIHTSGVPCKTFEEAEKFAHDTLADFEVAVDVFEWTEKTVHGSTIEHTTRAYLAQCDDGSSVMIREFEI